MMVPVSEDENVKFGVVSLVGVVTAVTSARTGAVVSVVVVSSEVVVLSVLFEPSSSLLQEMMVRLKRNMEKMMSICLTRVPISGLGEPYLYQNCGDFTRKWVGCGKCVFYSSSIIPLHFLSPFVVLFSLSVFCLLLATF